MGAPCSVQCHGIRATGGVTLAGVLPHTSARFDQSKAIRWRGWGRLASAFSELPLEPWLVLASCSREQTRPGRQRIPIHEARPASSDLLSQTDNRPRGNSE